MWRYATVRRRVKWMLWLRSLRRISYCCCIPTVLPKYETAMQPFVDAFSKFRKASINFVMSVLPSAWYNSTPTVGFSWKFILNISLKSVEKIQVRLKSNNNGYFHEHICAFMISRSVILRMRNVSDKSCRQNPTHILGMFSTVQYILFSFRKSCRLWANV